MLYAIYMNNAKLQMAIHSNELPFANETQSLEPTLRFLKVLRQLVHKMDNVTEAHEYSLEILFVKTIFISILKRLKRPQRARNFVTFGCGCRFPLMRIK